MSTPATGSAANAVRTQRRPYRYALALVLTIASLIALALLYTDHSVSLNDKVTQIGAGLAASVIFAVIYTILANREYSELIRTEIAGQLTARFDEVLRDIRQTNQLFLPTEQYSASRDFDRRFNTDLTRDLCQSNSYFFRGTSAKYIPARLRNCNHHLEVTQVLLLDPRDEKAIEDRAADRLRRPEYEGKRVPVIKAEIKEEILFALVALFDCREYCDIDIGFSTTTSPARIEVFDDAIYMSLYRSSESQRNTHPETARFSSSSQIYQIFRDEWRRQFQLAKPRERFTTSHGDVDLCNFAELLGFGKIEPARLREQRQRYATFIGPFETALANIGVAS
jgi:hypothetical protein